MSITSLVGCSSSSGGDGCCGVSGGFGGALLSCVSCVAREISINFDFDPPGLRHQLWNCGIMECICLLHSWLHSHTLSYSST